MNNKENMSPTYKTEIETLVRNVYDYFVSPNNFDGYYPVQLEELETIPDIMFYISILYLEDWIKSNLKDHIETNKELRRLDR